MKGANSGSELSNNVSVVVSTTANVFRYPVFSFNSRDIRMASLFPLDGIAHHQVIDTIVTSRGFHNEHFRQQKL